MGTCGVPSGSSCEAITVALSAEQSSARLVLPLTAFLMWYGPLIETRDHLKSWGLVLGFSGGNID